MSTMHTKDEKDPKPLKQIPKGKKETSDPQTLIFSDIRPETAALISVIRAIETTPDLDTPKTKPKKP